MTWIQHADNSIRPAASALTPTHNSDCIQAWQRHLHMEPVRPRDADVLHAIMGLVGQGQVSCSRLGLAGWDAGRKLQPAAGNGQLLLCHHMPLRTAMMSLAE